MNVIDKVVIKNGVDADTVKTINLNTGQVDEINAILATISTDRGVASYNVNSGNPQFVWSGVGDNEMWIYIDGIGLKVNGITSNATDNSIKVLPNSGSTTYVYNDNDNGKILIITNQSGVNSINANALLDGASLMVLNNSTSNKTIAYTSGVDTFMVLVKAKTFFNIYRNGSTIYQNVIFSLEDSIKNIVYVSGDITNITDNELKFPFYEFGFVGAKTANIPSGWPSGKELILSNIASGNLTVNLPSGQTFHGGFTFITLTPGSKTALIYSGASGFWHSFN